MSAATLEQAPRRQSKKVRPRKKSGEPISKKLSEVTWTADVASKGGFSHFMLKEIFEQPRAVATGSPASPTSLVCLMTEK